MERTLNIQVERFASPGAFLAAAESHLAAAEVENALILGVARMVAERPAGPERNVYFACVRDGGRILQCAFRSLPHKAGITRSPDPATLAPLAEDLAAASPELREITGPEPTASEFASVLARIQGRTARRRRGEGIYVLRAVIPVPSPPSGMLRLARESERDLVTRWVRAFGAEVGEETDAEDIVERWMREERLYVWDDGGPVSIAGPTGKTTRGVRVSLVYTPPERRGRGYASVCVASLSQRLLDEGNEYCCLYTDLGNPTSNKIYRAIGYEPVCDAGSYYLE